MLKYIPALCKEKKLNLIQRHFKIKDSFYNYSKFSFCIDINFSLNTIKNSLANNSTEDAFKQMKVLLSNWDNTKINFEEFKKVLYDLNVEFLKQNQSENFENLFATLMTTFEKNESEINSIKMQVNLALFYFNDLFQLDSGHIIKKCLSKINSLMEIEKFNESKENFNSLQILRLECNLNLLRLKFAKKGESPGIIKELDKLVDEFEKNNKQFNDINKHFTEITKCEYTFGDFYITLNQFEKALIHLNKMKNIHPNILSEITSEAILYKKFAICYSKLNQIEMTIFYLNKNISELEKSLLDVNLANNYTASLLLRDFNPNMYEPQMPIYYELAANYDQLTNLYLRENNLEISKELGMKALDLYKKSKCNELLTININFHLCCLYNKKEEFSECIFYGEIFLHLIEQVNQLKDGKNKVIYDMILSNLNFSSMELHAILVTTYVANSYFDLENFEKSKFYGSELYKLTKDKFIPNDLQSLSILNQAAQINLIVANYVEALELFDLILNKFLDENNSEEEIDDLAEDLVEILYGKAEALFQLQNHQLCKETYLELLNFAIKYDLEIYDEKRKIINERIDQLDFLMSN